MKKTFAILLVVLCIGIVGCAREEKAERLFDASDPIIEAKRQKIEAEIAQLKDHPWAGQYARDGGTFGFTSFVVLTLAPDNGFTEERFVSGNLRRQKHGTIDWDGNILKLSFEFAGENDDIGHFAPEYKPIRWGERVYLIPDDEIMDFCDMINARYEPRNNLVGYPAFFLRNGDETKKAKGKPKLPEEFMPFLLDKPVDATIVSIKDIQEDTEKDPKWKRANVTVVVDKGRKDGLLPGMKLYGIVPHFNHIQTVLTNVEETQSEFKFNELWKASEEMPFFVGWQLSTCPSWSRDRGETE
jgi:hypothetical protein